jgi:hypothetical protein
MKTRILNKNSSRQNYATKTAQGVVPTPEDIRRRAQELFKARGGAPGGELDDWLRAEQQLKKERATIGTSTEK